MASDVEKQGNSDGNLDWVGQFAPTETHKTITIKNVGGADYEVVLKRYSTLGDYTRVRDMMNKRLDALKLHKGSLPVKVSDSDLTNIPPEAVSNILRPVPLGEGMNEVYVTDEEEIKFATQLELAVEFPKMSWKGAVLLCKLNATVALKILEEFNSFNMLDMVEQAKNV